MSHMTFKEGLHSIGHLGYMSGKADVHQEERGRRKRKA